MAIKVFEIEDNSTEVHFKDAWECMVWMSGELRKRGMDITPLAKDMDDKVWLRYAIVKKEKKIWNKPRIVNCQPCNGVGQIAGLVECPHCKGLGYINLKKKKK